MTTYVVRLQKDAEGPQQFVGVFVAHSRERLKALVEDCCSALACEYAAVPADGMYNPEHKVPGPDRLYEESAELGFRSGQMTLEEWPRLFFGNSRPVWQPLCEGGWRSDDQRRLILESAKRKLSSFLNLST